MAAFKFRLKNFLSLKEKIETQKKLAYGIAVTELETEKSKLNRLNSERAAAIKQFRKKLEEAVEPLTFRQYNYYLELVKKRISEQEKNVERAEQIVIERRTELIAAMRERKTLEVLEEKEHIEFQKEQQKLEQKAMDEIVSYQYNTPSNAED